MTRAPLPCITASTSLPMMAYNVPMAALGFDIIKRLASIDVSREATDRFVEEVDAELSQTVWANSGNAHGYYRDQGKKVVIGIARHNSHIWHDTRSPRAEDFEIRRKADAGEDEMRTPTRLSM